MHQWPFAPITESCFPSKGGVALQDIFFDGYHQQTLLIVCVSEPNVAFWTYKKTSCLTQNGACATAKQQNPEGRTGPAGHGPQCLTLLSEPTRKLAVWPKTAPAPQPNSRALRDGPGLRATAPMPNNVPFWTDKKTSCLTQNGACATAKQQGPEGRTGPAGHSPQCLTFLSEPTRKLAVWPKTAPAPQPNSRALRDGWGLRATAPTA